MMEETEKREAWLLLFKFPYYLVLFVVFKKFGFPKSRALSGFWVYVRSYIKDISDGIWIIY